MMPPCASAKMLGWPVREGHGKAVNLQQIVVRRRMADSPKTDPSVLPTQAAQGIWLEVLAQSLMAEAGFALDFVAQTAQQVAARLQVMCGLSGHPWHQVVVEVHLVGGRYLSIEHAENVEGGCPVPPLCAELSRGGLVMREGFDAWITELHQTWSAVLGSSSLAWGAICQSIGALLIARALERRGARGEILSENLADLRGRL